MSDTKNVENKEGLKELTKGQEIVVKVAEHADVYILLIVAAVMFTGGVTMSHVLIGALVVTKILREEMGGGSAVKKITKAAKDTYQVARNVVLIGIEAKKKRDVEKASKASGQNRVNVVNEEFHQVKSDNTQV
ncbi:hypothetical protein [Bdellovibrio sp. BCCA]|uniref:hypothetical protein n=1 Tax=Bdellovibrio sp. BCCA TaxID=3136281 RepID=UPI0030F2EBDA